MKMLLKWVFRLLLLLAVLVGLALVLKDPVLRSVAEKRLRTELGMDATIESFHVGVIEPVLHIKNVRIYNPKQFDNARFVDIPEIYVSYDPAELAAGRLRCPEVRYHLADVNIVEDSDGKTNLKWLEERLEARDKAEGRTSTKMPVEFAGIDKLQLKLGRLRYSSFKNPGRAREIIFDQNLELRDIKSSSDFYNALGLAVANIFLKQGMDFLDFGFSRGAATTLQGQAVATTNTAKPPDALPMPTLQK